MRLFWLVAFSMVTVVMAAMTPYVFHHESTWSSIGWTVMLVGSVVTVLLLVRVEWLIRSRWRAADDRS